MSTSTSSYTPYWGAPTASEDWCEPNYVFSRYIAEFFNVLSSVPIVFAGCLGIYVGLKQKWAKRFIAPSLLTVLVGLGSIAFHGTLQYCGQAMDELFVSAYIMGLLAKAAERAPRETPRWSGASPRKRQPTPRPFRGTRLLSLAPTSSAGVGVSAEELRIFTLLLARPI